MRDALNATGRRIYYSITQGVPYDDGPSRSKMHCYGESVFTTKPCAGRSSSRAFILQSEDSLICKEHALAEHSLHSRAPQMF